jgi:hypothetical protein
VSATAARTNVERRISRIFYAVALCPLDEWPA